MILFRFDAMLLVWVFHAPTALPFLLNAKFQLLSGRKPRADRETLIGALFILIFRHRCCWFLVFAFPDFSSMVVIVQNPYMRLHHRSRTPPAMILHVIPMNTIFKMACPLLLYLMHKLCSRQLTAPTLHIS